MGKEFQKKYMHPTRRKLVDLVQTGEYDTNTTIGYTKAEENRNVGDIWEDEHHRYEKKEGYTLKTGKNSDALAEIRKYLEEKSKCKNSECKTIKKTDKDLLMIQKNGYCLTCTVDMEHLVRTAGFWKEYQDYKVATRMLVYGKQRLEELTHSLTDVKPYYEYVNEDGTTERWELPKSVEEVTAEIQELIEIGKKEIEELENTRLSSFEILKENNLEHYL